MAYGDLLPADLVDRCGLGLLALVPVWAALLIWSGLVVLAPQRLGVAGTNL
jgi:hypothetical protein